MTIDSNDNLYIAGQTPVGLFGQTQTDLQDAYITKFNSSNGAEIWSRQFVSSGQPINSNAITVDSNSNVYLVGSTYGKIIGNLGNRNALGSQDIFVAKYASDGTRTWVKQYGIPGGQAELNTRAVVTDVNSNVYVTFGTGENIDGQNPNGYGTFSLIKFDTSGSWVFTKQIGAPPIETSFAHGYGLAKDTASNIFVYGVRSGVFPGNPITSPWNFFIAKFDMEGNLK